MHLKWFGAVLVICACGGAGLFMAAAYRQQVAELGQLVRLLEYMAMELSYRLTPLPELCRCTAGQAYGRIKLIFESLADNLEQKTEPDCCRCMTKILETVPMLPELTRQALMQLGASMGQFDLEGQLKGLECITEYCRREQEKLSAEQTDRLRSYQTLGLCAGAALAILLI